VTFANAQTQGGMPVQRMIADEPVSNDDPVSSVNDEWQEKYYDLLEKMEGVDDDSQYNFEAKTVTDIDYMGKHQHYQVEQTGNSQILGQSLRNSHAKYGGDGGYQMQLQNPIYSSP
jgi:hypothetical protein